MSEHDNTSHRLVRQRWVAQARWDNSPGGTRPRGQIPYQGPFDAVALADMATFIEAPPVEYPPFDIEKFLRDLPAVATQDVPTEPEDVCPICLVKHNHENSESFLTEHPCRLPCGHMIGRACVARWLRPHPGGSNANSCPNCRHRFFAAWPAVPSPPARNANIDTAPLRLNNNDWRFVRNREQNIQAAWARRANVPAVPLPTNANDRRVARNIDRRPPNALTEEEVNEVEARIGERVRRGELRTVNIPATRPPRHAGQVTRILPTPLDGIIQQMQERGINLPGPEPPRNARQATAQWNAEFEHFMRQMQEHGIMNFLGSAPSENAGQEAPRQGMQDIDFHVRMVEDAGFRIRPDMGRPSTAREHEEILGRRAANRRQVALRERDLYTALIARGARLPQPENPTDELLDHRQDQALFEWLQGHSAFRGLALNEAYRVERGAGRTRNNREIYDMLRDCGLYWEIDNDSNGRWRTRERYLFDDEEEHLSDTFQDLLLDAAFTDAAIRRQFPGRDDYYIFRRLLEARATWNSRQRQWSRRSSQTGALMVME